MLPVHSFAKACGRTWPPPPLLNCCAPLLSPCPPPDYNFIRLGKDGFRREFDNLYRIYDHLKARLEAMGKCGMSCAVLGLENAWGWANAVHSIAGASCWASLALLATAVKHSTAQGVSCTLPLCLHSPPCAAAGHFQILSTGDMPVLAFRLKPGHRR